MTDEAKARRDWIDTHVLGAPADDERRGAVSIRQWHDRAVILITLTGGTVSARTMAVEHLRPQLEEMLRMKIERTAGLGETEL